MNFSHTRCSVHKIQVSVLLLSLIIGLPVLAQEPPPARVMTSKITRQTIHENQSFIGLISYDRVSKVSSEIAGLVKEVMVREGDQIKAGAPLMNLDTELLETQINVQMTRIAQITLEIGHAEKNYSRLQALFAQEGISEKDLDDARYAVENARLGKQQAEQELKQLQIRLRKSVILAPFTGIVLAKQVDTGVWIQQGKDLITLAAIDDLKIRVPLAETQLKFIKTGIKVPVLLTASGKEMNGTISKIAPVADAQTKNVFVDVKIVSQPGLAENMSATVFFPVSAPRELAIIPRDALIKFQGKDFVYTVKEDKASILPVHIVSYLGDTIGADDAHLTEGLPIVVEGNERLQPDKPVTIAGEK
ncbi:MAG: efflux RND transporter periplasmic adaptor subunit [Proteobacteria bacterium]|nr:efflux RND transporter periplasmic adaptor subunit [Pseudomonadota bacterium]MBU1686951.1 efflux RND transporter periplasmic adaptor subunit [Pseudomonadota bacterium]